VPERLAFTVYCTPAPQGSKRGWVIPGKNGAKPRAIVADANNKTKPYRQLVTQTVIESMQQSSSERPWAVAKVPVWLSLNFYVLKPQSAKKRICPAVKPDIDNLGNQCEREGGQDRQQLTPLEHGYKNRTGLSWSTAGERSVSAASGSCGTVAWCPLRWETSPTPIWFIFWARNCWHVPSVQHTKLQTSTGFPNDSLSCTNHLRSSLWMVPVTYAKEAWK
jgi:Holliday junction resolvase RusA-like endonuclease